MKTCNICKIEKAIAEFRTYKNRKGVLSYLNFCIVCLNDRYRERSRLRARAQTAEVKLRNLEKEKIRKHKRPIEKQILRNLKINSVKRKFKCELTIEDISPLPTHCPVLGIPLQKNRNKANENSYSIDRIDNTKGYVKGNIVVVSNRANKLKSDATLDELEKIFRFYKKLSDAS